jgi:hypothetical protein
VGKDDVREPLIALMKDRVPAVRIAAARALGFWAARQADKSAALAALRRAEQDEPNLHVKLEALAARARLGDRSTKRPLEAIVEEGPEWRRFTARAALVALGEKTHLAALHEQLMAELARVNLSHSPRPYEIIRLLGWCGDPASLKLLDRIPVMPCADADPYDGGEQRRSLLAACSLASWRIRREQKTP